MFEKYLNAFDDSLKPFFEKKIKSLSDEQIIALNELINRMENAGCKNPFSWAFSEITENIPQFARFLVLKNLFEIANDIDRAIEFAEAYADNYSDLEGKILQVVDKSLLKQYLAAYNRGMIGRFVDLIDEGNKDADKYNVDWALLKTDSDGKHTEQIIQGLHEDLIGFENE